MPRIKDLSKWILRRINRVGDAVEFKVIMDVFYINRKWYLANTIRIVMYENWRGRRVGVVIKHSKPDLIEFKEFLTIIGAINYIQSRYPQNIYIYYYTKKR